MTEVFFVRHAEPNYENHNDRLRELSAQGQKDIALVTQFLLQQDIQAVFSSPYKRAIDTISEYAEQSDHTIELMEEFRERKVGNSWIDDFDAFAKNQWSDFSYKLPDGESLLEVQERNIQALNQLLTAFPDRGLVIGSHGTALSTIIHYYDPSFQYESFKRIQGLMPWIVQFSFNGLCCERIRQYDVFQIETMPRAL